MINYSFVKHNENDVLLNIAETIIPLVDELSRLNLDWSIANQCLVPLGKKTFSNGIAEGLVFDQ
jgi:hypothetical protein